MSHTTTQTDQEGLRLLYGELCNSYHKVDDFRAKLLALLPLVSGVAIFELLDKQAVTPYLPAIGCLGAAIGLGLLIYELKGIHKCVGYIHYGCQIEQQLMGQEQLTGHFKSLDISKDPKWTYAITEPIASAFVYAVVIGAWVYLALIKIECTGDCLLVIHGNLLWPVAAAAVVWLGVALYWVYCMKLLENKNAK